MTNKLKKLTLQYAYLKLEKEEVDEICSSVEGEMRAYLEKHYPEYCETFFAPPIETVAENPPLSEEETEEETEEPAPPKNKDLKKLYRRIAEKTHPDRAGNNDYTELFSQAAEAYANNDIGRLLDIAGAANIELTELSPESVSLLKNNIETIFKEIYNKKQTTAWAWYNAQSDEEKEVIIKNILIYKGVTL